MGTAAKKNSSDAIAVMVRVIIGFILRLSLQSELSNGVSGAAQVFEFHLSVLARDNDAGSSCPESLEHRIFHVLPRGASGLSQRCFSHVKLPDRNVHINTGRIIVFVPRALSTARFVSR